MFQSTLSPLIKNNKKSNEEKITNKIIFIGIHARIRFQSIASVLNRLSEPIMQSSTQHECSANHILCELTRLIVIHLGRDQITYTVRPVRYERRGLDQLDVILLPDASDTLVDVLEDVILADG